MAVTELPTLAVIPFSSLNIEDLHFCLLPESLQRLCAHQPGRGVENLLVAPPLLQHHDEGFRIVYGWEQVQAQKEQPGVVDDHIPCFVAPRTWDMNRLWHTLILVRRRVQPLSPVEWAVFRKKILPLLSEEEFKQLYMPILSDTVKGRVVWEKILSLTDPLLVALHTGLIGTHAALLLADEPKETVSAFIDIITTLKLGANKQKKLLEGCREMALRGNISLWEVLKEINATGILSDTPCNPPQQAARLLGWLTSVLQPRLQQAEKKWHAFVAGLQPPKHVTCSHSTSFEKDEVTLTITCPSQAEAASLWERIKTPVSRVTHR